MIVVIIVGIILASLAFYIFAPNAPIEADEDSPLLVADSLNSMDKATKAEFEKQVDEMKDKVMEMSDSMSSGASLLYQANFKPRAHDVKGKVLLIESDGKKILRFEDFETINGPNLHIYLASDLGNSDFIDLGEIKATKGNVNYELPDSIDIKTYNKVLVWCVPFRVLFSYAELEESPTP